MDEAWPYQRRLIVMDAKYSPFAIRRNGLCEFEHSGGELEVTLSFYYSSIGNHYPLDAPREIQLADLMEQCRDLGMNSTAVKTAVEKALDTFTAKPPIYSRYLFEEDRIASGDLINDMTDARV